MVRLPDPSGSARQKVIPPILRARSRSASRLDRELHRQLLQHVPTAVDDERHRLLRETALPAVEQNVLGDLRGRPRARTQQRSFSPRYSTVRRTCCRSERVAVGEAALPPGDAPSPDRVSVVEVMRTPLEMMRSWWSCRDADLVPESTCWCPFRWRRNRTRRATAAQNAARIFPGDRRAISSCPRNLRARRGSRRAWSRS